MRFPFLSLWCRLQDVSHRYKHVLAHAQSINGDTCTKHCAKVQEKFLSRAQTTCHKTKHPQWKSSFFLAKNLEVNRNPTHGGEFAASELRMALKVYYSMN